MYFIIIIIIVALDQLTKYLIRSNIDLNSSIPLIDGIFHLTYIQNSGAAFSILENKTSFLITMQLIVIAVVLTYLIKRRRKDHWCLLLSVSLIAAGGIGNLIDRALNGYVVDFFDFRVFPIFNVADISVSIGAVVLILYVLVIEPKRTREIKQGSDRSDRSDEV